MEQTNLNEILLPTDKETSERRVDLKVTDDFNCNKILFSTEQAITEEEDISYKRISLKMITSALPVYISTCITFLNGNIAFHFLKTRGDINILGAYGLGNS